MILHQLELGPMQNFVYLVGCPQTREAVVVDPGWEPERIQEALEEKDLKLKGILATHYHFDHVNGIEGLLKKSDVPVYVNEHDAFALKKFEPNLKKVHGEDTLQIGTVTIRFLHTPGHTPGSQCFRVEDSLVSGDTLFINYCGRCDLPGGSTEEMFRSLSKLRQLDNEIILYPGHNYADTPTATLGEQKKGNPYFKCESLPLFLKAMGDGWSGNWS
ncbi:MAG: MBL fold metallo-hydrolase [Chlamydiae bacterium]|nr:MBL fold metallo-hydrolase [Chlamydiota bacterium]MBI3266471.1 MBL fold metallo-hydrolase [Chlamydiota bacterium]